MFDKKFIVKSLLTAILTAVVMFLLSQWMESFKESNAELKKSIDANTAAHVTMVEVVNQLRIDFTGTDAQIVVKFDNSEKTLADHETRIRELEKK